MDTRQPRVVHRDRVSPMSWAGGETARFLLRASDTGGLFSFYEVTVPPDEGSVLHTHLDMDETFYVIDGEFEIEIGDERHTVAAGTLAYGPRGVPHSFVNSRDSPSTMLCITTPGGIENFFTALNQLMSARPRPEWDQLRDLAARHGIVSVRPTGRSPDAALDHLDPGAIEPHAEEYQ